MDSSLPFKSLYKFLFFYRSVRRYSALDWQSPEICKTSLPPDCFTGQTAILLMYCRTEDKVRVVSVGVRYYYSDTHDRFVFCKLTSISPLYLRRSIGGSVVECSPATRAARVRFPADAINIFNRQILFSITFCQ